MLELITTTPTFWATSDEKITKILNAQWLKWGPSALSIDINTDQTLVHVCAVDSITKETVNIECKIQIVREEEDPVIPNTYFKKKIIKNGPADLFCTPNKVLNIRVHFEACSQQFNHQVFRIAVTTNSINDSPVFSPPFYIATKCRSEKVPSLLTITMEEIEKMKNPAPKSTPPRKRSRHEKLFEVGSSDDEDDSSDDDDEEAMFERMEKIFEKQLSFVVDRILQGNKQIVEHINRRFDALKKKLDELDSPTQNNNTATMSPFSVDMFGLDRLLDNSSSSHSPSFT